MKNTDYPNRISSSGAPDAGRKHPASHFDVGIYGLWYGNNYGSIATYYALHQVITSMGMTCAMVSNPLGSEPDIGSLVRSHSLRFARDHYNVSPKFALHEMTRLNGICDRFVLGSDQMWNITLSRPYRQSYFLDFADEDHAKIAYAASFGRNVWRGTEEERLATVSNLRRFSAVSVRDAFSHDILRRQFGIDSTVVPDPVFLCSMEDYRKLIDETQGRIPAVCLDPACGAADDLRPGEEPYLFAYILDPDASAGACLSQIAEETALPVYVAFDEGRYVRGEFERVRNALAPASGRVICLNDITLQEWLLLLSGAQYVLTDSFHGACFSILFQKPFIVKKNVRRGGARFDHLLSTFALTDRMVERSDAFYEKFKRDSALQKDGADRKDGSRHKNDAPQKDDVPDKDGALSGVINRDAVEAALAGERRRGRKWLQDALLSQEETLPPVVLSPRAVTSVLAPDRCAGCGACVSVCPKDALAFGPDRYGYYVPSIDYDACVNCGRCEAVCPALHLPARRNAPRPDCRALIAADEELLFESSSGGVFSLLARQTLREGGAVAGAVWNRSPAVPADSAGENRMPAADAGGTVRNIMPAADAAEMGNTLPKDDVPPASGISAQDSGAQCTGIDADIPVRHILADTPEGAVKMRKSKYLQSYMGTTDRQVKRELDAGRRVLFTGCPCQVAGLLSYLGKDYDNLIAVDLLCGNAPSAGFFRKYLEESFPQGVTSYQFRDKAHGWNANTVRITPRDGSEIVRRGGKEDLYQKAYHSHLMCPPHCETCPYQEAPRYGDLTIGDFWGYTKKDASVNTAKGISAVLINSEKGRRFLAKIPEADILLQKPVPFEWLGGNGSALPGRRNWASPMRDEWYRQITEHSFREAMEAALSPEGAAAGKEEKAQRVRIRQLEQELAAEQRRREAAEQALGRIEQSKSYRFGRMVSAPLRKLRKLQRKIRRSGKT